MNPLRVLYFGTFDRNYSRNRILINGLRLAGAQVVECNVPLWSGTEDKVSAASGRQGLFAVVRRVIKSYVALVTAYRNLRWDYDVMVLGYAGQIDTFLARVLTWLARRPLVLDVFMSVYLISLERGLARQGLLRTLENIACRLPDKLIIDTAEYAQWFDATYHIPASRFCLVPTGADDSIFKPMPPRPPDGLFRVVFYGTFIPLHGVQCIIQAAELLQNHKAIYWELIGQGPTRKSAEEWARNHGLTQVVFTDWIDKDKLPFHASQADILLGVFGSTEQSKRTIQNKIYEALALARPIITGDSPTVRSSLRHREYAYLIERENPAALAQAILDLQANPGLRDHIAREGHRIFLGEFTVKRIGERMYQCLQETAHPS